MKKKGSVLIVVVAIVIIGVAIGGYFLMKGGAVESETLMALDEDMLCYDILEEIAIALDGSCSDDTFGEILVLMGEDAKSLSDGQGEECAANMALPLDSLLVEFCGEGAVERFDDVWMKVVDFQGDATACFDKQAMGLPCD